VKLGDRYVLARNAQWPEGFFSLISGFLEAGEDPAVAIARETKEELGLVALQVMFVGHYPFTQMNQLMIVYVVHATGDIRLNHELAECKVMTEQELRNFDFGPMKLSHVVVRDWFAQSK
jgi:NADH pyrophosphatase NudC (nudix superfamily)